MADLLMWLRTRIFFLFRRTCWSAACTRTSRWCWRWWRQPERWLGPLVPGWWQLPARCTNISAEGWPGPWLSGGHFPSRQQISRRGQHAIQN